MCELSIDRFLLFNVVVDISLVADEKRKGYDANGRCDLDCVQEGATPPRAEDDVAPLVRHLTEP
jgi:hypothetical protein